MSVSIWEKVQRNLLNSHRILERRIKVLQKDIMGLEESYVLQLMQGSVLSGYIEEARRLRDKGLYPAEREAREIRRRMLDHARALPSNDLLSGVVLGLESRISKTLVWTVYAPAQTGGVSVDVIHAEGVKTSYVSKHELETLPFGRDIVKFICDLLVKRLVDIKNTRVKDASH